MHKTNLFMALVKPPDKKSFVALLERNGHRQMLSAGYLFERALFSLKQCAVRFVV